MIDQFKDIALAFSGGGFRALVLIKTIVGVGLIQRERFGLKTNE